MMQAYIAAMKPLLPFGCQVDELDAKTGVRLAQGAVPENEKVDPTNCVAVSDLEATIRRSPTAAEAARVHDAESAAALATQFAPV
jgi:hypothetical protein